MGASFWKSLLERAVKTFCQAALALLVGDGLTLLSVDWPTVASVAGLAAVVSVLTSIASAPFGPSDSPSLTE